MGTMFSTFLNAARLFVLVVFALVGSAATSRADTPDLPLAAASPMAGFSFDDKPLYLPVQKNFQMAMLTAGNELGRSCGKMEAYGWRMNQSEQSRVDQIFNTTVDRLRGLGYVVELQTPNSISRDITMFTADRDSKHILSMWSAGEIGLVMVMCETGAPRGNRVAAASTMQAPSVQTYTQNMTAPASVPAVKYSSPHDDYEKFSPVGNWVGSYVCGQGYTGGTLSITQLRGENFEGEFHFYPTARNTTVPEGRYTVYGQYDRASQRILVNPGRWVKRPADYYNTIIVGSFDVMANTLSAYFQGINGCTSFEARLDKGSIGKKKPVVHHKHAKPKVKKVEAAKPVVEGTAKTVAEPVVTTAPVVTKSEAVAPKPDVPAVTEPTAATPAPEAQAVPSAAALVPAPVAEDKPPLSVGAPTDGVKPAVVPAPEAALPAAK